MLFRNVDEELWACFSKVATRVIKLLTVINKMFISGRVCFPTTHTCFLFVLILICEVLLYGFTGVSFLCSFCFCCSLSWICDRLSRFTEFSSSFFSWFSCSLFVALKAHEASPNWRPLESRWDNNLSDKKEHWQIHLHSWDISYI